MQKQYVVSADIHILMKKWAQRKGYAIPDDAWFKAFRWEFVCYMRRIFPHFVFIEESEIINGLDAMSCQDDLYTVSLDPVYFQGDAQIDMSRTVDSNGCDAGLAQRADTPTYLEQLDLLRGHGHREVALLDDVIFSGDFLVEVRKDFQSMGISVPIIYAGVGVRKGVERLCDTSLVRCVRSFGDVIDEVCERDFYPGIPMSGRLLMGDGNVGVPYILPFGNPCTWASLPESESVAFSRFCIGQTIKLFKEIERLSDKVVRYSDVERKVLGLHGEDQRYVTMLQGIC